METGTPSARRSLEAATLEALTQVAAAGAGSDVTKLAALAVETARRLLDADAAVVFRWDAASSLLQPLLETASPVPEAAVATGEGMIGRCYATRLPVKVDDYQSWEGALPISASRGMRAAIAVPLLSEDRVIGALGVWTYSARDFQEAEVQLLTLLAAQLSPALESTQVNLEREDQTRLFRALHEVAVAASGIRDPAQLARVAVDHACELISVDRAFLWWWDVPGERLRPLADTAVGVPEGASMRAGQGAAGIAFEQRQPVVIDDYQNWPQALPKLIDSPQSVAVVPLLIQDRALGVLGVTSKVPRGFTPKHVEVLRLLASQVAPAIEAARLLDESRASLDDLRALHEVAIAAGGLLDSAALADLTVKRAAAMLGVDGASLRWYDDQAKSFRLLASTHPDLPSGERGPDGIVARAFEEAMPIVVTDYPAHHGADQAMVAAGIRTVVAVPLIAGDRPVGVLLALTFREHDYSPDQVRLATLFAAQVAPALEAARLAGEGQRQARVFRALHELAVAAGGVLEPARLCQLATEQAAQLLVVERAVLSLWDEDEQRLRPVADTAASREEPVPDAEAGQGSAGQAFQRRQPVLVDDYDKPGSEFGWARSHGYRSALAVPLLAQDKAIGTLCLLSTTPRRFTAEDVQLVSLLSAQVSPAIESAHLHAGLAGSERAFRAIHDTAPTSISRNRLDGRLLSLNNRGMELFGYGPQDIEHITRQHFVHPDDLWLDEADHAALLRGELDRYSLERRYLRKDGSGFWGEVTISLVRDSGGRPDFYYAMVEDITERKLAEQALRESEARFRTVFDRAAIGIARLDMEGVVIDANPTLHRMLGRPRASLRGTWFGELLHPDDQVYMRLDKLASREPADFQVDLRYRNLHGIEVWGNTIVSLVRPPEGDPSFAIVLVEDITVRKVQEVALEHRALHDALTDLPNRSLLQDRLQQAIVAGRRESEPGALLVMDLDRFKDVNDAFGHHYGDGLLQQVAVRLRAQLRSSDTVARLGGDEFAIVLPDVDDGGAAQTARKLLDALEARFHIEGESFEVGASIGIALFPEHGEDQDLLMRHADVAMYVAKRSNSGYALYSSDQDTHSPTRLALMTELREAIDQNRLVAHFQPIVSVSTGRPVGVEALVRWDHPDRGLIYPDDFIPAAEQTGLIRPLTGWVLAAAVEQARAWREAGLDLVMSINLSTRNLHDPHLTERLAQLLKERHVDPGTLQLEITESALMADPEHALRVLRGFAEMGLRLSIDDYGTGYSSLAYLRRLPAEELKIDKSFVAEMAVDGNDAVIVRSTIELGHNLGLRVVAEGVEDAATWKLLRESGCDLVQGQFLSRPLPAAEIVSALVELELRNPARPV